MPDAIPVSGSILTHEGIRKQLHRILDGEAARSSGVLARFLQFVVEETLQGRKFEIKEYTIGTQVFKRPASFAPHADAIVRINAGRLRRLLVEYYEGVGKSDEIRIEIPKGTYIPVFRVAVPHEEDFVQEKESPAAYGLTLAVLRFGSMDAAHDGAEDFADSFSERLSESLYSTQEFSVIAYGQSRRYGEAGPDIRSIGKSLNAQYLITGNIRFSPEQIKVNIQLVFSHDATIVWSETYQQGLKNSTADAIQTNIADKVRTILGSLCGVFINHLSQVPSYVRSLVLSRHESIYWLYLSKQIATHDILTLARLPVEESIRKYPHYSTPLAVEAHLHLDSKLMNVASIGNSTDVALELAERCVSLNPRDQHGYVALAYAHLVAGHRDETIKAVERALLLGTHPLGIKGFAGAYLICAGDYHQGARYLLETTEAGLHHSWFFDVAHTLYYFSLQDYENAYLKANLAKLNTSLIVQLLRASATAKSGRVYEMDESQAFQKLDHHQARKIISGILLDERVVDDIVAGWQAAADKASKITG